MLLLRELIRQEALGKLKGANNVEGSGEAELQHRTKSNNSLNPTPRLHVSQEASSDVN